MCTLLPLAPVVIFETDKQHVCALFSLAPLSSLKLTNHVYVCLCPESGKADYLCVPLLCCFSLADFLRVCLCPDPDASTLLTYFLVVHPVVFLG